MVGPVEGVGASLGAPGVLRPRTAQPTGTDFAQALRDASGTAAGPSAAASVAAAPPVDIAATLQRMQRVTAHIQQARAYFQPPVVAAPPRINDEA